MVNYEPFRTDAEQQNIFARRRHGILLTMLPYSIDDYFMQADDRCKSFLEPA